jgi:predicted O-methyltransferase YrrM
MTAQERIASLSTPVWELAALAAAVESGLVAALDEPRGVGELAGRAGLPVAVATALLDVLAAMDLAERDGDRWVAGAQLEPAMREPRLGAMRDDLRTTLLQAHALFATARSDPQALAGWRHTDEDLLQAQGRLSASVIPMLAQVLFPHVPGLLGRLESGSGAFLDVGAGVAAVSIAMCRQYPAIRAVGLEPASVPFALARRNVVDAGMEHRIELRDRRVEELDDDAAFDVAWLPASFLSADTFSVALDTVHRALRPGGLLLTGALDPRGADGEGAVARLRLILWGGDSLTPDEVVAMIEAAGYVGVTAVPRQSGRLVPMHARRSG